MDDGRQGTLNDNRSRSGRITRTCNNSNDDSESAMNHASSTMTSLEASSIEASTDRLLPTTGNVDSPGDRRHWNWRSDRSMANRTPNTRWRDEACSSPVEATRRGLSGLSKACLPVFLVLLLSTVILQAAEACSSRSTPTPRPPTPPATSIRPNITFQTYACPPAYAAWYCLNGATCFTVKIGESLLYNCECADGYMGQRCEYKDLDGTYLPTREKVTLETASIAGGATVAVILVAIVCIACWVYLDRQKKKKDKLSRSASRHGDAVDGFQRPRPGHVRPFSSHGLQRHKSTFHMRPGTFKLKYSMHPDEQLVGNDEKDTPAAVHCENVDEVRRSRLSPSPRSSPQRPEAQT